MKSENQKNDEEDEAREIFHVQLFRVFIFFRLFFFMDMRNS